MQINTQICATRGERAAAPAGLERKVLRRDGDTKKKGSGISRVLLSLFFWS